MVKMGRELSKREQVMKRRAARILTVLALFLLDGTWHAGTSWEYALLNDFHFSVREELSGEEEDLPREILYVADELFFSGTATEVAPIRSVDRTTVGDGQAGPVTRQVQKRFQEIVHGEVPDTHGWLTLV